MTSERQRKRRRERDLTAAPIDLKEGHSNLESPRLVARIAVEEMKEILGNKFLNPDHCEGLPTPSLAI
jgi:hypothetical protein